MSGHGHGTNVRTWMLAIVAGIVGLAVYLLIPQHKLTSGVAVGLGALVVLKHVGLVVLFAAPITAFVRTRVLPHFRRR